MKRSSFGRYDLYGITAAIVGIALTYLARRWGRP